MNYIQKKTYDVDGSQIYFLGSGKLAIYPTNTEKLSCEQDTSLSSLKSFQIKVINWFMEVFLPRGYPYSVSSDYLQYQIWDSLQAYCSNLTGAISLHSTLVGIGVGQETASPLTAAISWLTKDGAGMISSITFAYYKGCDLDNNSKQWRIFADIVNDGAHFIKLLTPLLPFPVIFTLCCSSIMSSLVGVAGGATRASLIQHQALRNNMADVAAKDGSQETLVNLAGLITSLTLLPLLTSNPIITWIAFITFVGLHIFTNYKAMRSLKMKTLNRPRLFYIFECFTTRACVPDIAAANEHESLFFGPAFIQDYITSDYRFEAGVSLTTVCHLFRGSMEDLEGLIVSQEASFEEDKYMILVDEKNKRIQAIYHIEAEAKHVLQSFWCAYLFAVNLQTKKEGRLGKEYEVNLLDDIQEFVERVKACARATFNELLHELSAKGWQMDPLRLKVDDWKLARGKQS